ncbi:uncharacterized protein LOC129743959 [Uranotaenia lowii]|uniref:uncharacterized protein LOC129743959 n=1 Tax=Uranotaenia lowii TaxID=190385 RepID=UPI0024785DF0|nr:uncharacterized protein LOC129743959 [Uranotaenia lowii]
MQFFTLHRKFVYVRYRNQLCSCSTLIVIVLTVLALILPAWLLLEVNPSTLRDHFRLVYEQPNVAFAYRYLLLAEVGRSAETSSAPGTDIISCSSFESYNSLTEEWQECNAIKVVSSDDDMDGKIDRLSASVSFNLPEGSTGLMFYTFYYFLDAEVTSQCSFKLPTIVALNKVASPHQSFTSGTIEHRGHLKAVQSKYLQCPFFMRSIKSHFDHNYYPTENFTTIDEFLPEQIVLKIENLNAAYFHMEEDQKAWTKNGSDEVTIKIDLSIGGSGDRHTSLLYNSSTWQKVTEFWIYYFPLLAVVLWILDTIKDRLFGDYFLRSLEIIP